jgi:hypothetical protein
MGKIDVVNKHHVTQFRATDTYIGRGSVLGNPYPITATASREQVIERYEGWLLEQIEQQVPAVIEVLNHLAYQVADNHDIRLFCFCAPRPCHGDVVKRIICEALHDQA